MLLVLLCWPLVISGAPPVTAEGLLCIGTEAQPVG